MIVNYEIDGWKKEEAGRAGQSRRRNLEINARKLPNGAVDRLTFRHSGCPSPRAPLYHKRDGDIRQLVEY
jgi:hypothetical protein